MHVVMRVVAAVGTMRRRAMYRAIRAASITAGRRERIRIVHVSIQRTHIHMLVETQDKTTLVAAASVVGGRWPSPMYSRDSRSWGSNRAERGTGVIARGSRVART